MGGADGRRPVRRTAATTTRPPTQRLAEVMAECDHGRDRGKPHLLPRHPAALFGPLRSASASRGCSAWDGDGFVRIVIEKPFGGTRTARASSTPTCDGVRRGAGLPHRPLPRQGDGAERAGAALRQLDLRADLEPTLGRQRPDHGGRDARRRHRGGFYETPARCATSCRTTSCRYSRSPDGAAGHVRRRGIRDEKVKLSGPSVLYVARSRRTWCADSTPGLDPR